MRPTISVLLAVFGALIWLTNVHGQSAQESLNEMIQQLQRKPTDDALRERLIKLARETKPIPAIPEDARRAFVKGNTAMADAKSEDDYARATRLYEEAALIAPWWSDPYFNLAKAQELRHDFNGAIRALKFFLLTESSAKDTRDAQDRVYVLEEKRDRMAKTKEAQRQEQARPYPRSLEGGLWKGDVITIPTEPFTYQRRVYEVRDGQLIKKVVVWEGQQREPEATYVVERVEIKSQSFTYRANEFSHCTPVAVTIEEYTITERYTCHQGRYGHAEVVYRRQR